MQRTRPRTKSETIFRCFLGRLLKKASQLDRRKRDDRDVTFPPTRPRAVGTALFPCAVRRKWTRARERSQKPLWVVVFGGCSKMPSSKAAGSGATEAYPRGYVAGRRTTENESGGLFQQPIGRCRSVGTYRQDGDLQRLRLHGSRRARIYGHEPMGQERQPAHGYRFGSIRWP
jgi:hypothetical protein